MTLSVGLGGSRAAAGPPPWGHLSNGSQYLVVESHAAPAVGIVALVRSGSGDEDPATQGASHFLEHLLFNGTESRTQEELYADLDRLGAYHNATTRRTHMALFLLVGSEALGPALRIQGDMLYRSTLEAGQIEKERGIILEELARDPGDRTARQVEADLFGSRGYGLPVLGTAESIRSLTREEIERFYRRSYVPPNVTWIVVGDVDPDAAVDSLEAIVGGILRRPGDAPLTSPGPPDSDPLPRDLRTQGAAGLHLAWLGPDPASPAFVPFRARVETLCAGSTAPLAVEVTRRAEAAPARHEFRVEEYPGFSLVRWDLELPAGSDPQRWERFAEASLLAVQHMPVEAVALEGWQISVEADEEYLREKPHYYGIFRGDALVARGLSAIVTELDQVRELTASELPSAPLSWPPTRRVRLHPAESSTRTHGHATDLEWVLPNGANVTLRSSSESPVLAAHVFIRDRSAREGASHAGHAEWVHSLLGRATDARSVGELRTALQRIGARIQTCDDPAIPYDDHYSRPEFSFVRFQTLDRFAEPGLELLSEILSAPLWTEAEARAQWEDLRGRRVRSAGSAREGARRCAADAGWASAASILGPETGPPPATADELAAWARRYLSPQHWRVVIASGLPVETLRPLVERTLGVVAPVPEANSPPNAPPGAATTEAPERDANLPSGGGVEVDRFLAAHEALFPGERLDVCADSVGAAQASIAWWRRLGASVDLATAALANAVVSERIAFELREKRGLAYGIGSHLDRTPSGEPVWVATAGTRPENAESLALGFFEVVAELRTHPPADDEIEQAAAKLAGRDRMRRLTRMNWAFETGLDRLGLAPVGSHRASAGTEAGQCDRVREFLESGWADAPGLLVVVR